MSGQQPLALIVEDHGELADVFQMAFREAGYETEVAKDGWQALARLETVVPDVIALDLQLPLVSGGDVLRRLRGDDRLDAMRVILVTAEPHLAREVQELADLVLLKPVSFNQLRDLASRLRPGATDGDP
ncbi:MAG TPA: response regulator [Candidatus Sulfomarinibacteraceae bacterium]|nr:response regulator [Candidatus Sulfomarinibacteraceae bacterium]